MRPSPETFEKRSIDSIEKFLGHTAHHIMGQYQEQGQVGAGGEANENLSK